MKTFQQPPSSPHFLTSTNSSLHHYTTLGFKKFPTLCCALCCPDPHLCRMDCTCSTSPAWTLLAPSSNPVLLRIILIIHLVPNHGKHCRNGFSTRRCGWAWKNTSLLHTDEGIRSVQEPSSFPLLCQQLSHIPAQHSPGCSCSPSSFPTATAGQDLTITKLP